MKTFHLPDLGEGLAEGEIVAWHVKEGDMIKADDPLVSVETAKAIVEVPSPYAGKIIKLHAKNGDIVPTGAPLADFEARMPEQPASTVVGEIPVGKETLVEQAISISDQGGGIKVLPAVRALAKKLNVDLTMITPTGSDNTIRREDVEKASQSLSSAGPLALLRGARRTMALTMMQSHREVVPVTVMEDADISEWKEDKDITVRVMLAMIDACQKEGALNAWYDGTSMGRRLIKEVHIGLAVDTPDGLFVPVIHHAQDKTATQLRAEIDALRSEIQNRTIALEKLQGASILLSNYGKFAGRYANPIIALPMVAILGVGAQRQEMKVIEGSSKIRTILPLSLTIDHRAVTGGEATRFLAALLEHLANASPSRLA